MRNHKSSNPQTFGEIISMIEDALASYHCAPTGDGAVPQSVSGAGHGAGQVPFLDDAGRERYGNPPDAAAASGAYMHRHITDEGRSSETARTPDIGTAHGFDETVSRLLDLLRRTGSLPEAGITIAVDTHLVPSHGHAFGPGTPCRGEAEARILLSSMSRFSASMPGRVSFWAPCRYLHLSRLAEG